jgi:hypothetical protein
LAVAPGEYDQIDADIDWGVVGRYGFNESRYVWLVDFYHPEGGFSAVLVDLYSGEVLDVSIEERAPS